MSQSATASNTLPTTARLTPRPLRILHAVLTSVATPFRFARHRPAQAVIVFMLVVLAGLLLAAVGVRVWFDYHLRAARREVDRGHNAAALVHLQRCATVRPNDREVLLLAARVARRDGMLAEAEVALDRYWAMYGDEEPLVFERLLLRATRGEYGSTAAALQNRIAAGGPDADLAREALVVGLLSRFYWAEAERLLADWRATSPDNTRALLLRGKLDEQRQRTSEAMLAFRRLLELDPEHDEARARLAALLLQLRQGEEALTHLTYLRGRLPDNAAVHTQLAQALALQGRTAEARAALEDCLRAHPNYPPAVAERARYAIEAEDYQAAEDLYRRAVRLDPGNAPTRHQFALVLARNGKREEAAREHEYIQQLTADSERINRLVSGPLQNNPNDPAIHHEIAMIAVRAGRPAEGLRWFLSALQVAPDYLPTHLALATYYDVTGNPALANRHRAFARQLTPSRP